MSDFPQAYRRVKVLGITLGVLNVVLWLCTPALRYAAESIRGKLTGPYRPVVANGVQELLVYFDPWLARVVFPVVYTLGLVAIPFLRKPTSNILESRVGPVYSVGVSILLLAFEAVWLFLLGVGVFLRGPNWNLYWPGEAWNQLKVVPMNSVNLSELFWYDLFEVAPIDFNARYGTFFGIFLRESPGIVFVLAYFLVGAITSRILFQTTKRVTPYWRWLVLLMLVQLAALVPIKMLLYWRFNLKYWIYIPEHFFNV